MNFIAFGFGVLRTKISLSLVLLEDEEVNRRDKGPMSNPLLLTVFITYALKYPNLLKICSRK